MTSTYQLFPGLKQILEDKRIRSFGVPPESYLDYLMAEQFVIDLRKFDKEDSKKLDETYEDMEQMGLNKLPYEKCVVHALAKTTTLAGQNNGFHIFSIYYFGEYDNKGNPMAMFLFSDPNNHKIAIEQFNNNPSYKANLQNYLRTIRRSLSVMLATRNAIKQRKDVNFSQRSVNGKPHKKGSGGYTIIREPEPHEIEGGHSGIKVRPHFRRGHIVRLDPVDKTRWIWRASCFVNGEPETQRTAYLVKGSE